MMSKTPRPKEGEHPQTRHKVWIYTLLLSVLLCWHGNLREKSSRILNSNTLHHDCHFLVFVSMWCSVFCVKMPDACANTHGLWSLLTPAVNRKADWIRPLPRSMPHLHEPENEGPLNLCIPGALLTLPLFLPLHHGLLSLSWVTAPGEDPRVVTLSPLPAPHQRWSLINKDVFC